MNIRKVPIIGSIVRFRDAYKEVSLEWEENERQRIKNLEQWVILDEVYSKSKKFEGYKSRTERRIIRGIKQLRWRRFDADGNIVKETVRTYYGNDSSTQVTPKVEQLNISPEALQAAAEGRMTKEHIDEVIADVFGNEFVDRMRKQRGDRKTA